MLYNQFCGSGLNVVGSKRQRTINMSIGSLILGYLPTRYNQLPGTDRQFHMYVKLLWISISPILTLSLEIRIHKNFEKGA